MHWVLKDLCGPAFAARRKVMGSKTIQRKRDRSTWKEPKRNGRPESLTADATF